MFRQRLFFGFFSLLLALAGCEQPAVFSPEKPKAQLVVVSNFTRDKAIQVFVSKSRSILDEVEGGYVLDATVEIYEGDIYLETLELTEPRPYTSEVPFYATRQLIPKVNTTYTIRVEAPGCEPAMAKSKIPASISLASASIADFALDDGKEPDAFSASYTLSLSFNDPSEEKNYYHLSLYQQIHRYQIYEGDTLITGAYLLSLKFNPQDNTNGRIAHINGGLLVEDNDLNNGKAISFELPLKIQLKKGEELLGKLFLELRAVTEEYYLYFSSLSRQKHSPDSPFSEPVILFDNIDGGLGIFAGYNSSLDSLSIAH